MGTAGRPSAYSAEVVDKICARLIEGETLYKICQSADMPAYRTVFDWLDAHVEFRTKCARARELQAEFMDNKILETADNATADDAYAAKVKIAAYQWRAMKLAPKKYGPTLDVTQTVMKPVVKREPKEIEAQRAAQKDTWTHSHANGKTPPTIQ